MNTYRIIAWLTGVLTFLLALFSFILSFSTLKDLANQHGVAIPALFPLIVEAAVIVFSLNALYRSLAGESTKWQWALIVGASILAGAFNIMHADANLLSQAIAAVPSLFLLLSFETFLGQIKSTVLRTNINKNLAQLHNELNTTRYELNKTIADKRAELDSLVDAKQSQIDDLTLQAKKLVSLIESTNKQLEQAEAVRSVDAPPVKPVEMRQKVFGTRQRRNELVTILSKEEDIGVSTLAVRLNTSRTTIYNDLAALQAHGILQKNGDSWQVLDRN